MADKTYTVTVASGNLYGGGTGNVYYVDGTRSSTGPGNIVWPISSTLRFEQSDASNDGHPLIFSSTTSRDYYLTSGVSYYLDGAVNYSDYINTTTFNAATTRYIEVDVTTPDFYYLCYVHGIGMGGLMDVATGKTWSVSTWGDNQWGDQVGPTFTVTGQALTASLGNESVGIDVSVTATGFPLSSNLGNISAFGLALVTPSGIPLTNNLGTVDAGPDAMLTGNQMSMGLGTVDAFNLAGWGRLGWGINSWGIEGVNATAIPTGIGMSANLGSVSGGIIVDVDVTANTLNVAQLTLGNVDPAPDAMITGNFMIGALGTLGFSASVLPVPTGIAMSANLGSVTVDLNQQVNVTGFPLTAALGDETVFSNVTVDLTGFPLTIALNNASALIWNEVNTGSAPIDPPGWQEVVA
jgi:hypothetical protein|tara:strand:- start:1797 stop:3023 length:1227 start_codon:yes stop_codon:yes gene_type:complete